MATAQPTPSRPKFWLEFRLFSDGLDTAAAQALNKHTHFALFPDLPPEIRLKVWEYLLAPRIVLAACLEADGAAEQREELLGSRPNCYPPVPVLLHVNHETRTLALGRYERTFAWKVPYMLAGMDVAPPPTPTSASTSASPSSHNNNNHQTSSSRSTSASLAPQTPTWSRPRVWFDFARDALYLVGELEPYDSFGFNSPMTYFLRKEDTQRVRRAAVAFGALRYGEAGSQQIFGTLFHVVDRFAPADGRVLVAVTPADEMTHALMGGEAPLVGDGGEHGGEWQRPLPCGGGECEVGAGQGGQRLLRRRRQEEEGNVVQKTWRDWYRGAIVTSSLANMEFELIREADLAERMFGSASRS